MPTIFDRAITWVATVGDSDLREAQRRQAENEVQLEERFDVIINDGNADPYTILKAQKEREKFMASRQDPAEGNGKLFVDTALTSGQKYITDLTAGAVQVIPTKIWIWAGAVAVVYLVLRFGIGSAKTAGK